MFCSLHWKIILYVFFNLPFIQNLNLKLFKLEIAFLMPLSNFKQLEFFLAIIKWKMYLYHVLFLNIITTWNIFNEPTTYTHLMIQVDSFVNYNKVEKHYSSIYSIQYLSILICSHYIVIMSSTPLVLLTKINFLFSFTKIFLDLQLNIALNSPIVNIFLSQISKN